MVIFSYNYQTKVIKVVQKYIQIEIDKQFKFCTEFMYVVITLCVNIAKYMVKKRRTPTIINISV